MSYNLYSDNYYTKRWSRAYYEAHGFAAARNAKDPIERRKHLNIGLQAQMSVAPRLVNPLLTTLKFGYSESGRLLDRPEDLSTADRIAELAYSVRALQLSRAYSRVFLLHDDIAEEPSVSLLEVLPPGLSDMAPRLFDVNKTDQSVEVSVNRVQVLAKQLGIGSGMVTDGRALIADIPYPWKVNFEQEGRETPVPWVGTLRVGERAIGRWVRGEGKLYFPKFSKEVTDILQAS